MMILVWMIIGFGIYNIFKNNEVNNKSNKETDVNAIEALKQRYVRGEIDDETYIKMMKVIKN